MLSAAAAMDAQAPRDLRIEASYYRAQHARAVAREEALKRELRATRATAREREATIRERDGVIAERDAEIEALKARIAWLEKKLFGRSTEATAARPADASAVETSATDASAAAGAGRDGTGAPDAPRRRGQQPGAPGHGRRPRVELPTVVCDHQLGTSGNREISTLAV